MQMATPGSVNHAKVIRVIYRNSRLDHSTIKLTMTSTGAVNLEDACGNVTVGQRRGGRQR